jgi:hypothetical protein
MRHPYVRIALVVLYVGGLALAAYRTSEVERERQATALALASFDGLAEETAHSIAALRAAQQSYVAAGQDVEYRIGQARAALDTVNEQLVQLKRAATSQDSATAVGAVAQAIDDVVALDARVQEYAANGQVLMASDIIFTDGVDMLDEAQEHLGTARAVERTRSDAALAELGERRTALLAATAGASLLVVVLLFVTGARAVRDRGAEAETSTSTRNATSSLDLSSGGGPPDVGVSKEGVPSTATAGDAAPAMTEIASLCCDLARVQDAHELPDLLARGARLLDASGLIVWLTAPGGSPLLPALTHGYDPVVVKRIGTIPRDADNATAAAYRSGEVRTVQAAGDSSAAIVAPLVGGHGCVGAMALEVAAGAERDPGRQSLAAIVAIQLAVLVSEAPAAPVQEPRPTDAQAGSG